MDTLSLPMWLLNIFLSSSGHKSVSNSFHSSGFSLSTRCFNMAAGFASVQPPEHQWSPTQVLGSKTWLHFEFPYMLDRVEVRTLCRPVKIFHKEPEKISLWSWLCEQGHWHIEGCVYILLSNCALASLWWFFGELWSFCFIELKKKCLKEAAQVHISYV